MTASFTPNPDGRRRKGDRARWVSVALVAMAALAVHARSIGFGFVDLDDRDLLVADRAFLLRPSSLLLAFTRPYLRVVDPNHSYYRPLVTASYALDTLLFGPSAWGYHLTNGVLHAAACVLVGRLLLRLSFEPVLAWLGAWLFAVHPSLASTVAWIPGRNDSLLAVCSLASWLFFLRARAAASSSSRRDQALSVLFFALALCAKETAVGLVLVCVAHDALAVPTGASQRLRSMPRLWLGWCGAIAARLAVGARLHAHASLSVADLGGLPALLATGLGAWFVPWNPSLLSSRDDAAVWPGLLAALLVLAALRFVPGVRGRIVALGAVVFASFLLPSVAAGGTLLLETRLYLPACGALIILGEIVRAATRDRNAVVAFSAVTLAALAALTVGQEGTFRDRRTFARAAVASAPRSPLAHFCLGRSYQLDGDTARALAEYEVSLSLGPTLLVHNNVAVIDMAKGDWTAAEQELRLELGLDPTSAIAYENLARVLRREGRLDDAKDAEARGAALAEPTR